MLIGRMCAKHKDLGYTPVTLPLDALQLKPETCSIDIDSGCEALIFDCTSPTLTDALTVLLDQICAIGGIDNSGDHSNAATLFIVRLDADDSVNAKLMVIDDFEEFDLEIVTVDLDEQEATKLKKLFIELYGILAA